MELTLTAFLFFEFYEGLGGGPKACVPLLDSRDFCVFVHLVTAIFFNPEQNFFFFFYTKWSNASLAFFGENPETCKVRAQNRDG